jgi:XTP/dITP diphosphohydrolase
MRRFGMSFFKELTPLVIATSNVHKIREIKEILKDHLSIDLLSLKDFPHYKSPEETGSTFKENAILKATQAAKSLKCWALAEDSGLIVPALNGEPGVFSARFAGKEASDAENRKKLLFKMQHLLDTDRDAYFECCFALSTPDGVLKKTSCATCEGTVLSQEKGGGGFGYDSLFVKHDYNKTFAELESSLKNKISHRRKALDKMLSTLEEIFS